MGNTQTPAETQSGFDAICSEVQEFEHLPTVTTVPAAPTADLPEEERTAPLDELILAGLVSP